MRVLITAVKVAKDLAGQPRRDAFGMVSGQWSVVSGQWSVVSPEGPIQRIPSEGTPLEDPPQRDAFGIGSGR